MRDLTKAALAFGVALTASAPVAMAGPETALAKWTVESAVLSKAAYDDDTYYITKSEREQYLDTIGFEQIYYGNVPGLKGEQEVLIAQPKGATSTSNLPIFVAFAGTEVEANLDVELDVAADINTALVTPWFPTGSSDINNPPLVHKGFNIRAEAFAKDVADDGDLATALRNAGSESRPVVFTGHSLGGAIAHLVAAGYDQMGAINTVESVITFGAPKVGNAAFSAFYKDLDFAANSHRWVIERDPVGTFPNKQAYAELDNTHVLIGTPTTSQTNWEIGSRSQTVSMAEAAVLAFFSGGQNLEFHDNLTYAKAVAGVLKRQGVDGLLGSICETTVTHGSDWVSPSFWSWRRTTKTGFVSWYRARCELGTDDYGYATLSDGSTHKYADGYSCAIQLNYSNCAQAPATCQTRIGYGDAWFTANSQYHDLVRSVVGLQSTTCNQDNWNNYYLQLSNGWKPFYKGWVGTCELGRAYEQCSDSQISNVF